MGGNKGGESLCKSFHKPQSGGDHGFLREFVENPIVLAFPFLRERQDPNQSQVDYLIDEFKIWSVPKFDSSGAAVVPERQYKPELLYHCTFDSAEAIERPASRFMLGVQWHPETSYRADVFSRRIFEAFMNACRGVQ